MAFFNEFKEKFNKAAQSVTTKTKDGMEISRLSGESRSISAEIDNLYRQIGRVYAESRGADSEALAPLCARVEELQLKLQEVEKQKMQLKNQHRCPACGTVMPKNARFCSACGRRMPEPVAEEEPSASAAEAQYCPECGAMLAEDDEYCAVCGHGKNEEAAAPEKIVVPVEPAAEDDSAEAPTDFNAE